jgi:predicted phage-related endonuclease
VVWRHGAKYDERTARSERLCFIGGSDARIILGTDEAALVRLWREKRGELEPEDYTANLIVQLGVATEPPNRRWYEKTTGQVIKDAQTWVRHPVIRWMAATLDGVVEGTGAVFEAKFMLPWSFSEEAAAEKHMAQVQHNMWVTNATEAVLSIITGRQMGGNQNFRRSPLPAPPVDRGKEVLALHRERRASSPIRGRAAEGPHRGDAGHRHELVKCLGGVL